MPTRSKSTPSKPTPRPAAAKRSPSTKTKSPRASRQASTSPRAPGRLVRRAPGTADSKQSRVIALLQSGPGATIEQMVKLTGWQPHTVRGLISGTLRKKLGLQIASLAPAEGKARLYRIVDVEPARS